MLDVPSRFGSTSFQSKDVNGAQKSEFLFWKINDYNYQWRTTIGSYNTGVNCWCLLNVTHCSNIRTFCTISNCEVLYVLCDVIKWRIQFARRPNFPLLTNRGKNQRKNRFRVRSLQMNLMSLHYLTSIPVGCQILPLSTLVSNLHWSPTGPETHLSISVISKSKWSFLHT